VRGFLLFEIAFTTLTSLVSSMLRVSIEGMPTSPATLIPNEETSGCFAWEASPNCFCQYATCSSTTSVRFLASVIFFARRAKMARSTFW
jgi:hypothetical protein